MAGRDQGEALRSIGVLASAGWSFVFAILIGLAGGYFLDRALGTSPWLFFLGFLVGFAAGVANLYRAATAASDSNRSPKP
jgi:ATP synthase protein I